MYKEMWLPHRQRFDSLLKPYSAGDTGGSTQRRGTQRVGVLSVRIYVGPAICTMYIEHRLVRPEPKEKGKKKSADLR